MFSEIISRVSRQLGKDRRYTQHGPPHGGGVETFGYADECDIIRLNSIEEVVDVSHIT
ncbi:MAG TPA: hypothetical protein VGB77_16250 [Abditibacteriaceae bacterium]